MSFLGKQAEPFLPDRDCLSATMPTTDLQVLMVLAREKGILRRFSTLPTVLTSENGPDEIVVTRDEAVVAVQGSSARKMKIGIGASMADGGFWVNSHFQPKGEVRGLGGGGVTYLTAELSLPLRGLTPGAVKASAEPEAGCACCGAACCGAACSRAAAG